MIELSLGEIARIVGGQLRGADPGTVVTGSVEYDSRNVTPGGLFVAFAGEHVDGHDYLSAAARRGAVAAVITRPAPAPELSGAQSEDAATIQVADAIEALTSLAAHVARRLPATVVGVTGSSGKTSTKDLLGQLLPLAGPTIAPAGSMNNELGHPYTVLRADARTAFLVLELGARGIGHVRHLCEIAPPRIGVVLNVGSAHLGEFGTRAAIAAAKGELVEALPPDGLAVLNADDPLVLAMAARTDARVLTVGESAGADVRAEKVVLDQLGRPGFTIRVGAQSDAGQSEAGQSAAVQLRLIGAHHVGNALAAAAVALEAGLTLGQTAAALSAAVPASRWRMELIDRADGVTIVNDAYNANPESMRAALTALASIASGRRGDTGGGRDPGGRSVAVLGEMAELGAAGDAEHDAVGRYAAQVGVARLIGVGESARAILRGAALEKLWTGEAVWVPDVEGAVAALRDELRRGDVVLIKASRAASLERVALAVAQDADAAPAAGAADERGHGA